MNPDDGIKDSPPAWLVIVYTLIVAGLGVWVLYLYGAWL